MKTNHVEGKFISTLFLVPKKKRDLRPVINLKPLNTFLRKLYLKKESIDVVKHVSKPGEYIATTIDLKNAYFSVSIPTHDRK